jgi:hypothetical protein
MAQLKDFASSVAIVVSSCNKFFDAWRPFAFFFRKFWPDCPFPVYLIVNHLHVRSDRIQAINVGKDKGWASNMQCALREISAPYVLYMQEDYFLTAPVDRSQLASDFAYAFEREAGSFRFSGRDPEEIDLAPVNDRFGILPGNSEWRTLCQVTLWKRDVFASALRAGETAWNMEARGSERTRDSLALSYARPGGPIPYLRSAISRGLWTREALALCAQHHFRIRPAFRPAYVSQPTGQRFRRALGRVSFAVAFAKQLMRPVDLDVS